MTLNDIVFLVQGGIFQVLKIILPVLGAALIVGLIVAVFQATTSIQEQTLTFLPKLLTILLLIFLLGGAMFSSMEQYFIQIMNMIPKVG